MKKTLLLLLSSALLGGCCAYTDIGTVKQPVKLADGATPVAAVTVFNTSYSLFGCLPISSGKTWQEGPIETQFDDNFVWFEDRATLDENLAGLRHALDVIGSRKVVNLTSDVDTYSAWSLFLVQRKVVKNSCLVVK
ncbi:MAG: hypothetical protein IJT88_04300 [Kiritimatiellae bacterium]|nr:hypothetical protein [Kiritimatiellia bacterium]MBQ9344419.1 hypothetical protein [Kiritimatiellia bacterium]